MKKERKKNRDNLYRSEAASEFLVNQKDLERKPSPKDKK